MLKVVDLFCGMGGLSYGFSREHFKCYGYDLNPNSPLIFKKNHIGVCKIKDMKTSQISKKADIVVGGPPCRPWSSLNLTRRGKKNSNYILLDRYYQTLKRIKPSAFLMENVLPLRKDVKLQKWIDIMEENGYRCKIFTVNYSEYGAPISRRRLYVVGFRNGKDPEDFYRRLMKYKNKAVTTGEAIMKYSSMSKNECPDHVWPELKTIDKYEKYYKTGKYGWYVLSNDKPAPSFGNIMKTYILHPVENNMKKRVISIREAMSLMGFGDDYEFPKHMGMGLRYQMIADSVSPVFSYACARVFKEMLDDQ